MSALQAELKTLFSPDIENLETWIPENSESFGFLLNLYVGVKGEKEQEYFSATVCTPQWYFNDKAEFEIIFGRHLIFMQKWDYQALNNRLSQAISSCYGETWREVMERVGRIALWEFEYYQGQKK